MEEANLQVGGKLVPNQSESVPAKHAEHSVHGTVCTRYTFITSERVKVSVLVRYGVRVRSVYCLKK